jgi:hypothetical protein
MTVRVLAEVRARPVLYGRSSPLTQRAPSHGTSGARVVVIVAVLSFFGLR